MVIISHMVTLAQPLLREEQQQDREDEFSIHRPAMQVKIPEIQMGALLKS